MIWLKPKQCKTCGYNKKTKLGLGLWHLTNMMTSKTNTKNEVGGGSMLLTYLIYYIALVMTLKGMRRLIKQKNNILG